MLKYLLVTDATKARPLGQPIPVQTLAATVKTLHEIVGASGTMGESTDAFLTNRVIARVTSVPVEVGNIVKKGALLAQLDDSYYASAVDHARTNDDHTSAQLERMLAMQAKGFASAVEVEQARTADTAAKEALVEAEFNLSCTKITAPTPAIVLQRNINPVRLPPWVARIPTRNHVPIYMVAQVTGGKNRLRPSRHGGRCEHRRLPWGNIQRKSR